MSKKWLAAGLVIIVVAFSSGLLGVVTGGWLVFSYLNSQTAHGSSQSATEVVPTANPVVSLNKDTSQVNTTITQAVEKVGSSVVTIVATVPGQQSFFFQSPDQQVSGSGVIVSEEGYCLTNYHVVEGANRVTVILVDGTQLPADLAGYDAFGDLAVLRVHSPLPAVAALGNSDALKPGETVIAIGSPLGDFKNSVTVGVISATGRSLDTGKGYQMEDLIQTDAAINHGNSGGPLINVNGEVIGINTLVVRGDGSSRDIAEGLGFAIPINTARAVAQQIIEKGYFARPYLGIRWQPITPAIASAYDLPVEWGVYVTGMYADSPADVAGVRRGDIIIRLGDTLIDEDHTYINALFSHSPGQSLRLTIIRNNQQIELEATLGEAKN